MNRLYRVLSIACTISLSFLLHGQVSYGGLAFGLMEHGPRLSEPTIYRLPEVDAAALLAEDAAQEAQRGQGPFRFGYRHEVNITMDAGTWTELDNGDRIWRLTLECPDAFSIGIVFDHYVVPHGGLVFLYNEAREQRGAFMAAPKGRTTYAMDQLAGERITIEYFEPAEIAGTGELSIGEVIHAYRDVMGFQRGFGDSGDCNINVICPEGDDWRDQIRSVALINTGTSYCSGALLNNCLFDGTPYLLTADHCLGSPVSNWIFTFNWDSPDCDPTAMGPTSMTVSGSELLVNNTPTDMALLLLDDLVPEVYDVFYSGWNISDQPAEQVTSIHHPSADIKKISRSFEPVIANTVTIGGNDHTGWQIEDWDEGVTETGSSGSGLWDQNGLLVGQLIGGMGGCGAATATSYYGRFDLSYPFMQEWLGDCDEQLPGVDQEDVVVPIYLDAAVTSITNVPALVCGADVINPRITLKNNGIHVITSVILNYGIQGEIPEVTFWAGSLMPGMTVNHQLPELTVPAGEHILEIASNSPNGAQDQVEENDSWTFAFTVNTPSEIVSLHLNTDNYGADTSWELLAPNGTQLYSGGPYQNGPPQQLIYPFCLSNGCYTFTINDVFGDGICCGSGQGSYALQNGDGLIYAINDGQFGSTNTDEFCLEAVSVAELQFTGEFSLYPNPTTGILNLRFEGIQDPHQLSIMDGMGRTIERWSITNNAHTMTMDLSMLADGIYLLSVDAAQGRFVQRVIMQR